MASVWECVGVMRMERKMERRMGRRMERKEEQRMDFKIFMIPLFNGLEV